MQVHELIQPLVFSGAARQATAVAVFSAPPKGLHRNDLFILPTRQLLVTTKIEGNEVSLTRRGPKPRIFGGGAYRRWDKHANKVDRWGELLRPYVPPPRRARPIYRYKKTWEEILVPAGQAIAVMSSAYSERS